MPRTASAPKSVPLAKPSIADEVFVRLREMAISYELKPGERLNEADLSERLGVSRTPVREALNRLAQEGFLVPSGRGYSRKSFDVQETLDLYEARSAVEVECARLAAARASDDALDEIEQFLKSSVKVPLGTPAMRLVELDEAFHERITRAAGNAELMRMLVSLNQRIRFIRWINMEKVGRDNTQAEHRKILAALRRRDADACADLLRAHITRRTDQIIEAITAGLARIYLEPSHRA